MYGQAKKLTEGYIILKLNLFMLSINLSLDDCGNIVYRFYLLLKKNTNIYYRLHDSLWMFIKSFTIFLSLCGDSMPPKEIRQRCVVAVYLNATISGSKDQ